MVGNVVDCRIDFVCPKCRAPLSSYQQASFDRDVIACSECDATYPILNSIIRFAHNPEYVQSFGFQWNIHARTQIDRINGTTITRDRFFHVTQWPTDLKGETVLEAGCGAGRFTQIIAETGAKVFSFDLSAAVEANKANNSRYQNVTLFQADINKIPLPPESFDRVFCFGVLQHTPDPKAAFLSLASYLKPGGHIAIDVYDLKSHRFPHPKYMLRPITKRLPPRALYRLISISAPYLLPIKRRLRAHSKLGRTLSRLVPIYDYAGILDLTDQQLLEWAILDTFDGLSAWHEHPQTLETVQEWFSEAKLEVAFIGPGPNGIIARGVRPVSR